MNKLTRILFSIFIANRHAKSEKAQDEPKRDQLNDDYNQEVETPPPQEEQDPFKIHTPNEDYDPNDVDLTGEYDPLSEMETIFTPLHGTFTEFYNIYAAQAESQFLEDRCELCIHNLDSSAAWASGCSIELDIFFRFLARWTPQDFHYRIYKVHGHVILAANALTNSNDDWYYITALDLPEGRFNPRIAYLERPVKAKQDQQKEYKADHSRAKS